MDEILRRIKNVVFAGNYDLSLKARGELDLCQLDESDVVESILNAVRIEKTIRSTSSRRGTRREYLHVIISPNSSGVVIYTKQKVN